MSKHFIVLLLVLITQCHAINTWAQNTDNQLVIPIRFHIVTNLTMNKNGLAMASWVSESEIRNTVLPAVTGIWRQANIAFAIEQVLIEPALDPPNKQELIDYVVNAGRDEDGESDPKRLKKLDQLIDWQRHSAKVINLYLVPYLGEASQGNAKRSINRVYVAQWSDKSSRAKLPPTRFQLVESRPFKEGSSKVGPSKEGSLSRTLAHELGHILGLKHPDKKQQKVFNRLMGGKKAGYNLTPGEIATARERSIALLESWQR